MKILFIACYDYTSFPIRTLQTFIKSKGYHTETVFFKDCISNRLKEPTKKEKSLLIKLIKKINPEIICISLRSPILKLIKTTNVLIKKEVPNSLIVWGGVHATICPEECIKHVEFVCVGEGELSLLEFIQKIENGQSVNNIKNFWIKKPKGIIKNELRPLLQNLDDVPIFDYSSENKYYIENNKLYEGDPVLGYSKHYNMVGRGCPFNCSYCSNSYFHKLFKGKGRYVRKHSVNHVIKELINVKKTFKNLKLISFMDEVFVLDKEWIKEFVKEYKKKIGVKFKCELTPSTVDDELIQLLKSAGLFHVTIGIQSGSERVRYEIFKRFHSDEEIIKSVNILRKHGIAINFDIITDNPYETKEDLKKSIKMLLKIPRPYDFNLFSLINFPKTDLTEKLINDGLISRSEEEKALSNWRTSLKRTKNKDHKYYNCLVSLLSKNFVPKSLIKFFLKNNFLRKNIKIMVIFTNVCNKIKFVSTGLSLVLKGDVSYSTFKDNIKMFKEIIN